MKLKYLSEMKKNEEITPNRSESWSQKPNSMGAKSGGKVLRYASEFAKPKKKVPADKMNYVYNKHSWKNQK